MVQRASEPVRFNAGSSAQLQGSSLGAAQIDRTAAAQPGASAADTVLNALVPGLQQLAGQAFQQGLEEEYLKGVAAAATVKSEEELQTNPITADWQLAGYRDTVGRVAYADKEAQLLADMPKLRKQDPKAFQEYLAVRRAELLPQLEGMSKKQRESMFGQLVQSDFAAVKKHSVEHQQYIVETKVAGWRARAAAAKATLDNAKSLADPLLYSAQLGDWNLMIQELANADDLPVEAKVKSLKEIAGYAIDSDHVQVYDMIASPEFNGKPNPAHALMPFDELVALNKMARASDERTESQRAMLWQEQDSVINASIDAGALPEEAEYKRHLQQALTKRFITDDTYGSKLTKYYTEQAKASQSSGAAAAVSIGDQGGLFRMGVSQEQAVAAWEKINKDRPLNAVVGSLLNMGALGTPPAYKRAAELSAGAWAGLQRDPTKMLPENLSIVTDTLNTLAQYEANGKSAAVAGYLAGFDTDTQSFIEMYRDRLKHNGGDNLDAAAHATDRLKVHTGKTGQQKASMNAANSEWEAFKSSQTRLFQTPAAFFAGAQDMFSALFPNVVKGGASAEVKAGVVTDFFEKDTAARVALRPIFEEISARAEAIANNNPALVGEPAFNMARSEVFMQRTITTSQGPLLMSKGVDIKQVYGANASHTPADIGRAIDRLSKVPEGFRRVYKQDVLGNLSYQDYDKKTGGAGRVSTIPASAIRQSLKEADDAYANQADRVFGRGKTQKISGVDVQFNGNNTAGVSNGVMFKLRDSLVKFEGVLPKVQQDVNKQAKDRQGNPVVTFGVGISSTNDAFPKGLRVGDVPSAQVVNDTFRVASDRAARTGAGYANRLGIRNDAGVLFSSGLAYQAGNWMDSPAYRPLMTAIAKKDVQGALAAFEASPAGRKDFSSESRREWYKYHIRKMLG